MSPVTRLAAVFASLALSGCVTERIIERPVPIQPPSLCITACPHPERVPATNGELLEDYQARGAALACMESRQACIREMVGK